MPLPATSYVPQNAPTEGAGHGWAAALVYRGFAGVCHQQAERSFALGGHALAVCARCAGIYAGFAACSLLYPLVRDLRRTDAPARKWLALALLPAAADFALNFA